MMRGGSRPTRSAVTNPPRVSKCTTATIISGASRRRTTTAASPLSVRAWARTATPSRRLAFAHCRETARRPNVGLFAVITSPPPSTIPQTSSARSDARPSTLPVSIALANRSTTRGSAGTSPSLRPRASASAERPRRRSALTALLLLPRTSAISSSELSHTSRRMTAARCLAERLCNATTIAKRTSSRNRSVFSGDGWAASASSRSSTGSTSSVRRLRTVRARRWSRQTRVVSRISQPVGSSAVRWAARSMALATASWTRSSASARLPVIR
jgi:hypothetical protein